MVEATGREICIVKPHSNVFSEELPKPMEARPKTRQMDALQLVCLTISFCGKVSATCKVLSVLLMPLSLLMPWSSAATWYSHKGSQDTADLEATVVIMSWNMMYNSSSLKEVNEVCAGNPTLSEVSAMKPINANMHVYDIDTSKLKSQVGPKSGWQLPFKQFYGSLSTPQEADYTNYVLLIVKGFLPETKQLFMLTRGWNKLPQTNVPSKHIQTQNSVSHLFIDAFFYSPRIIVFCWMLSLSS